MCMHLYFYTYTAISADSLKFYYFNYVIRKQTPFRLRVPTLVTLTITVIPHLTNSSLMNSRINEQIIKHIKIEKYKFQ
jgi:hypothetical protein